MSIINFTIAMYLSIFIHELGHYLSCKAFKVPVKTFSIGFGPKLFRFKKFNTDFTFKLIPMGGYVYNDDNDLNKINIIKEYIIILSGVFINIIAAIISFSLLLDKSLIFIVSSIFTNILPQFLLKLMNLSNILGSELALSSTLPEILNNSNSNMFLLVFASLNLFLFALNILPLPILDGGQLIMSIIRRWGNKSLHRKNVTKKISNIIYLICYILLLSPLLINEFLRYFHPIQIFLFSVIVILISFLFKVITETNIYKNIIKK
ncbi:MAG: site-2 protease family protein [Clostridium perfringens]